MKKLIYLATICVFLLNCEKTDSDAINNQKYINEENIVSETYWFQEKEYVLYFDKNGDGDPINQDVALSLQIEIENSELISFRDVSDMHYVYLFDSRESYLEIAPKILESNRMSRSDKLFYENNKDVIETRASPNFLEFWEHCNEVGLTMVGEDNTTRTDVIDDCSYLWEHKNLALLPKSNGGTWNDVISDFDVVPEHAIDGTDENDGLTVFYIFRDSDFPTASCKVEGFFSTNGLAFESDCLQSSGVGSYWCFWGGNINDSISSWRITYCIGSNECKQRCFNALNW